MDEGRGRPSELEEGPQEAPQGPGRPHPGFCSPGPILPPGALSVPSSAETLFSLGLLVESRTRPRNGERGELHEKNFFFFFKKTSYLFLPLLRDK